MLELFFAWGIGFGCGFFLVAWSVGWLDKDKGG